MDLPLPETWAEASERVLPVIRRRTEPAHAWAAERADPANRLLREPFAPYLCEMVVLDLPDVRMFLNAGHLERWGVAPDAAFAAARHNLQMGATTGVSHREDWGLWNVASGDGYESSRLCLPGWLDGLGLALEGRPVVAVPTSRALLIADSESVQRLAVLLELSQRAFRDAGNPLSPVLYRSSATGGLEPWVPAPDHPLAARVAFSHRLLQTFAYSEQAEQLAEDAPEHVAPIALERTKEHSATVATVDALPALVPACDQVLLEGEPTTLSALRHRLEPTELDPPRWRLS